MAPFFLTLFALSATGMLAMLLVRRYEIKNNRLVFARARPKVAQAVETSAFVAGTVVPLVARHWGEFFVEWCKLRIHRATAWCVLWTERVLERVLRTIRHSTAPKAEGEASEFLREVAEHKKQLQESVHDHTIVE